MSVKGIEQQSIEGDIEPTRMIVTRRKGRDDFNEFPIGEGAGLGSGMLEGEWDRRAYRMASVVPRCSIPAGSQYKYNLGLELV